MKKDYKTGRIEVEGRTFQIEFWTESHFGLPYVSVSEIKTKETKSWFSNEIKVREVKYQIDYGWCDKRLDWAMGCIVQYLQKEKDDIEELRRIDSFCSKVVGE